MLTFTSKYPGTAGDFHRVLTPRAPSRQATCRRRLRIDPHGPCEIHLSHGVARTVGDPENLSAKQSVWKLHRDVHEVRHDRAKGHRPGPDERSGSLYRRPAALTQTTTTVAIEEPGVCCHRALDGSTEPHRARSDHFARRVPRYPKFPKDLLDRLPVLKTGPQPVWRKIS